MKYNSEIIINASREIVVALFEDTDNFGKWQPGFISIKHVSGEDGKAGAKYELKYKIGKRDVEMVETIIERNLPEIFTATYEAKNVWNEVKNHFEELPDGTTRFWAENEFRMRGFMKLMAWLMPGVFKKQTQKFFVLFKDFVEKEGATENKS